MKPVLNRLHISRPALRLPPSRQVGGLARSFGDAIGESIDAWRDLFQSISIGWVRTFTSTFILPISAIVSALPVAGLVFFETPDNSNALGLFFVAITICVWLTASAVMFLVSRPRENAWTSGRCLIMGVPVAMFALFGAMLQGARMMAPTTLVIGITMVALGEYILWPRISRSRNRAD